MSEYSNYRRPSGSNGGNFSARQYFKDNLRVLRKNLVFCSGLPLSLTDGELKSHGYFGKYGKVTKVTMLRNIRQMSVYLTYSDPYEASLAIIATNDFQVDRYHKLASIYGTIKYCKYFLKKIQCKNLPNCNYLHVLDKKNQIYINNQLPDQVFDEHYSIAMDLLSEVDVKQMIREKRLRENSTADDVLPCPIQTLNRILKDSQVNESFKGYSQQDDGSEYSGSEESCSQSSDKDSSEEETYQTITAQTLEQNENKNQDFPKLSGAFQTGKKQKYKQKSKVNITDKQKQLKEIQKQQQENQKQKQQLANEKETQVLLSTLKLSQPKQLQTSLKQPNSQNLQLNSSQSLQIKLIRRLLRESSSKLNNWTQLSKEKEQQQEINFFHKELSELNELRQLCQSNILKQINKEEQRVKFLLIKNIQHKKHHHVHHDRHHHTHHHNKRNHLLL